jgi:bifunctional non-homologous end joining protein LigD
VKPDLVVEIAFNGWTRENQIRQGHFLGLREDKPAKEVVREMPESDDEAPKPAGKRAAAPKAADVAFDVRLTHPEKLLYPDANITKYDLADYLRRAAPRMLPFVQNRLISLVRCPDGITQESFFQKHPLKGMDPSWLHETITTKHRTEEYLYLKEPRALVAAAQWSVLEFHIWGSALATLEKPDRIVFDLDPDEGFGFDRVKIAAFHMQEVLEALGLQSLPLLSGGKGVHVVVPIRPQQDWPAVKAFSAALVDRVVAADPDTYVGTMSKAKRQGKLFIDHFRNERGSTAIAPYSPRAREGAPVAWPVSWDELKASKAANMMTIAKAMEAVGEPNAWDDYAEIRQSLTKGIVDAVSED